MKSKGVTGSTSCRNSSVVIKDISDFKVGRPKSLNKEELEKLLDLYYSEPISIRVLAKMFGVSRMTVWRTVKEVQTNAAGK